MKKPDFSNAKAGDKVFSLMYGWGEVIANTKERLPILVDFKSFGSIPYTGNGEPFFGTFPELWWDEWTPEPPESALVKPDD